MTRIVLPPLHKTQLEIAKNEARFKVVCCGRRWGKTLLGITLCVRSAVKGKRIWWVAPTYKQAREGWAYLMQLAFKIPGAKFLKGELEVTFPGGGQVQIRTEGGDPNNLRGSGLDGVVLDEAAYIKPESWELVLRPALADKQGWALFISTPQHYNWFYELYERGEKELYGDWASWQAPTWDNPYVPETEIETNQREMLPEDFDQEFGASFTAVGGAVFRLLSANRQMYLRPMPSGLEFADTGVGMDWGTTKEHNAAVVNGGRLRTGAVWIRSAWLDHSASSNAWREEAVRTKRDYGARFARVDRSQSSELDRLKAAGFTDVEVGNPNVEVRIGEFQSLVQTRNIFFDSEGPGVREYFNHLCSYHRDREGKIVEEEDDDVDAGCYLVSRLVRGVPDTRLVAGVTTLRTGGQAPPGASRLEQERARRRNTSQRPPSGNDWRA